MDSKAPPLQLYDFANVANPELLAMCEIRRYTGYGPCNGTKSAVAGRYTAYRYALEEKARSAALPYAKTPTGLEVTMRDPHLRMAYVTTLRSLEFLHPTYFVAPEFLQAAIHTRLPEKLETDKIPWPMQAMTFIMPKGALISPFDGECTFLSVAFVPKGWMFPAFHPGPDPIITEDMIHVFSIAEQNSGPLFASALPTHDTNVANWGKQSFPMTYFDPGKEGDWLDGHSLMPNSAPHDRDQQFIADLRTLAIKLVLMTGAVPHLVEDETLARPAKMKHGRERPELWNPRVIGRNYRIKRPRVDHGGTHASPRMHWRDGHTRLQPYGPRENPSYKSILIEPVLVNADSEP